MKINPIFKVDGTELVSNCRPISILTAFSKLLERIYNDVTQNIL